MKLSIACVTQAAPTREHLLNVLAGLAEFLEAELVWGAHGSRALEGLADQQHVVEVHGEIFEELIDPVLDRCTGDYVLRIDDDERVSAQLAHWIRSGAYLEHDSWFFSRYHLWPDDQHVIVQPPYFPDFQQRLTTRAKAYRPHTLHAASPYPAWRAPTYLEHHCYIIEGRDERRRTIAKYEALKLGQPFNPEDITVVFPFDDPAVIVKPLEGNFHRLQHLADSVIYWRQSGQEIHGALKLQLDSWLQTRENHE